MKLTIAKADLMEALKVVSACKATTGSDLSAHYLFNVFPPAGDVKDVRVELAAYSGQTFASSPISGVKVEGDDANAFTIEGWRLEKWLGALPDDGQALVFTYTPSESKTVEARATKGAQQFDSLDPTKFPSWDEVVGKSTVTGTLPASLLYSILDYAKDFVGDDETKHAEQTVVECRKGKYTLPKKNPDDKDEKPVEIDVGIVYAMDGMHAVQIKSPLLKDCTMRIHGKDLKGILAFLATLKNGMVDLLEDLPADGGEPTTLFLRPHPDAVRSLHLSVYGENRFTTPFPELGSPGPADHYSWSFPKEDALAALPFLEAGAAEKDKKVRLAQHDDVVQMSMRTPRGVWVPLEIPSAAPVKVEDAPDLPSDGFMVNKDSFKAALKSMPGETPQVGVNKHGRGGYLRFTREEGPNGEILLGGKLNGVEVEADKRTIYLTVVAWVK